MTDAASGGGTPRKDRQRVGGVLAPAGISWALFEFARNPYFMLIVTYVFPPYFAQYIVGDPVEGQAVVAGATFWAGIIGAITAPILGAMMDKGGARKPLMAVFVGMLMVSGIALWWSMSGAEVNPADPAHPIFHPPPGGLAIAGTTAFLVLGFVGYTYSEMMHNAMLRQSGRPESLSRISGAGIGLGQLSSALCLIGLVVIVSVASSLGGPETGFLLQRGSGPFVAFWLLLFVVPFFIFVPDGAPPGGTWLGAAKQTFSRNGKLDPLGAIAGLFGYLKGLFKAYPEAMKYLLACLIFKDGITALLALGGVYSSGVLGWDLSEQGLYGIWASIFGVIGGLYLAGLMDRTLGPRLSIVVQLSLLSLAVVIALGITRDSLFYGLVPLGDANGPEGIFSRTADKAYLIVIAFVAMMAAANISTARYMMITLAPKERISEFFGLFAMSSTATVWLGPMLTEIFTRTFHDQRIGFSPILILLLIGLALMFTLKKTTGAKGQLTGDATPGH